MAKEKAKENPMLLGIEMPYNQEAEQSVLGAVLVEPSCLAELIEKLRPESFYSPANRAIFGAMTRMFTAGEPVDFITLLDAVIEDGVFQTENEAKIYLSHLMEVVPTVRNLSSYVGIILDKQLIRNLIEVSGEIINEARETGTEGSLLLDSAEQQIYDIRQGRDARGLIPVREAIYETYDRIRLLSGDDREKYLGIKTGYADLDRITGGFNKSDLVLLAARPGMGKTSFALNIAANLGIRMKKKIAIFSLEMSTEQVTSRMLSSESFVESRKLRMGELEPEDWTRLAEASQLLSKSDVLIDDSAGVTVSEIKAKLRRIRDLDLVIIDYLQLLTSGRRSDNRVQEVSEITRNLKLMAKELNVPVIVLSQLSRAIESRQGHKPMLSDLRESGSIEQDADLVMFLYRESYYQLQEGQPAPENDSVECLVLKNRHGETGSAFMRWDAPYTRFFALEDR